MAGSEKTRTTVLFVDIEGGWGGSSRSLYYLIRNLDRKRFAPLVLLGKRGPAEKLYQDEAVDWIVFAPIPRTTAMRKKNLRGSVLFMRELLHLPRLIACLKQLKRSYRFEIVHLNHESLFFLGVCCKILFDCKVVYHVRTMIPRNVWAAAQVGLTLRTADHVIFITENERNLWLSIDKKSRRVPHSVIYNSAEQRRIDRWKWPVSGLDGKFKVISLMTISFRRGTDRLVEIARCFKRAQAGNIIFVVCGKAEGSCRDFMEHRIREEELESYFVFLGHQSNPESLLDESDVLIRPSRENNPWGRDIIEAMTYGKAIIAVGSYDGFVEHGINGYLHKDFNPRDIAEEILFLGQHPEEVERMGNANREKANKLFDGTRNAAKVAAVYDSVLQS